MDPFQNVVNLEEQYYAEGHALGMADGAKAGRAEGRQFGMEKGFEKFSELGRLNGRATVLALDGCKQLQQGDTTTNVPSERLHRQLLRLKDLTDIESVSTENSEDGVADVDDRLREANAKASLVSKMSGKDGSKKHDTTSVKASNELEDFRGLGNRGNKT